MGKKLYITDYTKYMLNPIDYVINPNTQRMVRIGSKTYNDMVRNGILEQELAVSNNHNNKIIYRGRSKLDCQSYLKKVKENYPLDPDNSQYYALGSNNTVILKSRKARLLKQTNIIPQITKASLQAIKELYDIDIDGDEEESIKLQYAINQQLVNNTSASKNLPHIIYSNNEFIDEQQNDCQKQSATRQWVSTLCSEFDEKDSVSSCNDSVI